MAARVIGGYVVLEELARGGSGAVFRARHPSQGDEVAIKVLLSGQQATDVQLERFRREAEALARLAHPGIVAIRSTGVEQGCPYLVMEFAEGRSLEQVIERERRFTPTRAAEITLALAEAVSHAHEQGILHRDLKPANVIVGADGSPRLTDFGLARELAGPSSLTRSGALMGTPAYWPPEQARGERDQVGPWSDVYGLGAILYAMLTASPPVEGDSLQKILLATENQTPIPPSQRSEVDALLEAICLRCLAKKPQARFPTAAALAEALEGYLGGAPAPVKRGRAWRVVGAFAVGVSLVAAALAVWRVPPRSGVAVKPVDERVDEQAVAPDARARLQEALAQYERGEYEAALALLDGLLEVEGVAVEAHCTRGAALLKRGRARAAEAALTQALALDPGHTEALVRRAAAWAELENLGRMERDLNEAVRRSPTNHLALYNRALLNLRLERLRPAVADATKALQHKPDQANALLVRGAALSRLKDHSGALRDLDRALVLEPDVAAALFQRTRVKKALRDFVGAATDLYAARRALKTHDSEQLRRSIETQLADLRRRTDALSPEARSLFRRSTATLKARDYPRAVAGFTEVLATNPVHLDSHTSRGLALIGLGRNREGLRDLRAAVALNPQRSNGHYNLGAGLAAMEETAQAIAAYQRATELDPDNLEAWVNLGIEHATLGNLAQGQRCLSKALSLNPDQVEALLARGRTYLTQGRYQAASADFRAALRRVPPRSSLAAQAQKLLAESLRRAQRGQKR